MDAGKPKPPETETSRQQAQRRWKRSLEQRGGTLGHHQTLEFSHDVGEFSGDSAPRRETDPYVAQKLKLHTDLIVALRQFHKIENIAEYRTFRKQCEAEIEELLDDGECIVRCVRTQREPFKVNERDRNLSYEFSFDNSQHIKLLKECVVARTDGAVPRKPKDLVVVEVHSDLAAGLICIKSSVPLPESATFIGRTFISTKSIVLALKQTTTDLLQGDIEQHDAISDFLTHQPPRTKGHQGGWLIGPRHSTLEAAVEAAVGLQESSLVIQGPPGCGKTYAGAQIIAALVKNGQRVGVTSNSHAAIRNLLKKSIDVCEEQSIDITCVTTGQPDDEFDTRIEFKNNSTLADSVDEGVVVGSTAWGFVRTDFIDKLDVLIVVEASQVSLANMIAMSRCARNLIVIGDQRQLGQPIKGNHEDGADLSALEFRLGKNPTVLPEEIDVAREIRDDLIGQQWMDEHGIKRPLNTEDILFAAPYNAQASRLQSTLGKQARVGTVDRFQGQEAPVVVVSLCLSADCATDSSLSFALDMKRLNVAVTKAQTMRIVLRHPDLMTLPLSNKSAETDIELAQRVRFLQALGCANPVKVVYEKQAGKAVRGKI